MSSNLSKLIDLVYIKRRVEGGNGIRAFISIASPYYCYLHSPKLSSMFLSVKPASPCNPTFLSHQFVLDGSRSFSERRGSTLFRPSYLAKNTYLCHTLHRRLYSTHSNDYTYAPSNSSSHEGSEESEENKKGQWLARNEILKKLRRYGVSGILSYGLLNTAYYLTTFLFVWFYIAPAPGRMGYRAAAERFLKMMAMVWAGSQVTKLIRAAGALALTPFVDIGLSWFTAKFKFQSPRKAFIAIVGSCVGLAIIVFLVITLLWA